MIIYVLDSSAFLRYIDNQAGADRINAILKECAAGHAAACISAVQWGEIAGNLRNRLGAARAARILAGLLPLEVRTVDASVERAVRASTLKADRRIGYAEAFALELAMDSPDHLLVTADYAFTAVEDLARIEFLPAA